jgi:hypothetical protein
MVLGDALRNTIERYAPGLQAIREDQAATPGRPGGWSRKEELGHLIDSVTINRVRVVLAATRNGLRGDDYDQEDCVRLNGYQELPWGTLVEFWEASNAMLARAVSRIPDDSLAAQCTIGRHEPITLRALIESYIAHMEHHLNHILGEIGSPARA